VLNVFLLDFYTRLKAWHQLKEDLKELDIETISIEVDRFWQKTPMSTNYLHPADIESWPNPWELLNDNRYCLYGRALGMVYTLMLLGIKDIDIVETICDTQETVILVLVDNAKYVLNGCPDSVLNTTLQDFTINKHLNIDILVKKIGK
jgi:hypothetical protein